MDLLTEIITKSIFIVGIYTIVLWCIENLWSTLEFAYNVIAPYLSCRKPQSLDEKFGKWAIVTGATDGIGKQLAMELAGKGLNICLIARNETKLMNTASEIESKYKVDTKCISIDFSKGKEIYNELKKEFNQLDVGILVNNVGRMYEYPNDFDQVPEEIIWEVININIGAVTMMSRIIIPQMKTKKRGLIVNISSGCELQPMPLVAVYAATKIYTRNFTLALQKELAGDNIKVHLVSPMFVKTNMISFSTTAPRGNLLFPTPEKYARSTINKIDKCSHTCGYWIHGIQYVITKSLPEFIRIYGSYYMDKNFRKQYYQQNEHHKKQFEV